jgi:hypothetical protein
MGGFAMSFPRLGRFFENEESFERMRGTLRNGDISSTVHRFISGRRLTIMHSTLSRQTMQVGWPGEPKLATRKGNTKQEVTCLIYVNRLFAASETVLWQNAGPD